MTIEQAINWLLDMKTKHGPDIEVYFDCPKCEASFTPNRVEAVAVHIKTSTKE